MADGPAPIHALTAGDVVWAQPGIAIGREQTGRRPALIVASAEYLQIVDTLALVVPITSVSQGWPNHIEVIGSELKRPSWAMSEQIRTISRARLVGRAGRVNESTLTAVRTWLADFLGI